MLVKKIKIQHFEQQRKFIENQLLGPRKDGNPSYAYVGFLFSEVRSYFINKGIKVRTLDSDEVLLKTGGYPIHIFTPNGEEMEILTTEELYESAAKVFGFDD